MHHRLIEVQSGAKQLEFMYLLDSLDTIAATYGRCGRFAPTHTVNRTFVELQGSNPKGSDAPGAFQKLPLVPELHHCLPAERLESVV